MSIKIIVSRQRLIYLIFGAILNLTACTPAEIEESQIKNKLIQTVKNFHDCKATVLADAKFDALYSRFPVDDYESASLDEMGSPDLPTAAEIKLMFDLRNGILPCRERAEDGLEDISPAVARPLESFYNLEDDGILLLSQKKITWGQYVTAMSRAEGASKAQAEIALDEIGDQLQQEDQAQRAEQAQAFAAAAELIQQEAATAAANRPIVTHCSQFGNQTTCTSN